MVNMRKVAETHIEALQIEENKTNILIGIALTLTFVLILRLFYLQIFNYKSLTQRAQYSTSKISVLVAPRGTIYDRKGRVLATNKQSVSAIVYPNKLKTLEEKLRTYEELKRILKMDSQKLKDTILKLPENAPLPIRIKSNISMEETILILEKQHLLNGVTIQEEPIRYYPNGSTASHVLGYIAEINESEMKNNPERKLGDLVGKYGIEKLFDDILRGTDGKTIVEVDRSGKPIDTDYKHAVIHHDPIPGKNIQLTVDLELQKATEEALQKSGASGGAIVVNPYTGEVLALASYPTFDPNTFTKTISSETWKSYLQRKVFLNRPLLAYVPGSIWKPVTLIAALESMAVKPNEKFHVSEAFYLGNTRFGDWTGKVGIFSLQESLAWSRDTAFYQIGHRMQPEQIREWGFLLGAGRKTGIELLGEEKGIVPDKAWKRKNTGEDWYPGNTLHYAIGQSFLLVTPAQVARIYSAIATNLSVPKLYIIKQIHNYKKNIPPPLKNKIDEAYLKVVKEGLEMCIESGTGQASKLGGIRAAGKTGSAEVPGTGKTHGWFSVYAPVEKPEITVVVLAEKAGHGGSVAAPIAKKILEAYFGNRIKKSNIQTAPNQTHTTQPQEIKKKKRFFFRR